MQFRIVIDARFTETEGNVAVQGAFIAPDGLPPEPMAAAQIMKGLEIARDAVLQQVPLAPPSVVEGKPRILVPR